MTGQQMIFACASLILVITAATPASSSGHLGRFAIIILAVTIMLLVAVEGTLKLSRATKKAEKEKQPADTPSRE